MKRLCSFITSSLTASTKVGLFEDGLRTAFDSTGDVRCPRLRYFSQPHVSLTVLQLYRYYSRSFYFSIRFWSKDVVCGSLVVHFHAVKTVYAVLFLFMTHSRIERFFQSTEAHSPKTTKAGCSVFFITYKIKY